MRWHKTGKTKPIFVDGTQLGCKKIMVLYLVLVKGGKPEKTNWVMHQYHLGTGEDEMNEEYVVSKVFCQQQLQSKQNDINKLDPVTANRLKLEKLEYQRLDCEPTTDVVCINHELLISIFYLIDKLLNSSFVMQFRCLLIGNLRP